MHSGNASKILPKHGGMLDRSEEISKSTDILQAKNKS
jgi:hypothetical protein